MRWARGRNRGAASPISLPAPADLPGAWPARQRPRIVVQHGREAGRALGWTVPMAARGLGRPPRGVALDARGLSGEVEIELFSRFRIAHGRRPPIANIAA